MWRNRIFFLLSFKTYHWRPLQMWLPWLRRKVSRLVDQPLCLFVKTVWNESTIVKSYLWAMLQESECRSSPQDMIQLTMLVTCPGPSTAPVTSVLLRSWSRHTAPTSHSYQHSHIKPDHIRVSRIICSAGHWKIFVTIPDHQTHTDKRAEQSGEAWTVITTDSVLQPRNQPQVQDCGREGNLERPGWVWPGNHTHHTIIWDNELMDHQIITQHSLHTINDHRDKTRVQSIFSCILSNENISTHHCLLLLNIRIWFEKWQSNRWYQALGIHSSFHGMIRCWKKKQKTLVL